MVNKFIDTKIVQKNVTTEVNRKYRKLAVYWTTRIPKGYKRNSIISDLNRALCISSSLTDEIPKVRHKFLNAVYPLRFINSVIKQFNEKFSEKSNEENDYIFPSDFCEIKNQAILIEITYCEKNETHSQRFLKKFDKLTNDFYEIKIKWITKKMKNLFRLKIKNPHPACVVYEEIHTCEENCIGETKWNVEIRWEEHSDINKVFEPSRHLKSNPTRAFTRNVLMAAPMNDRVKKNLEALFTALSRPSMNGQIDSKKLLLFRNGVSWQFYSFNLWFCIIA